jgi:hypothetical protein
MAGNEQLIGSEAAAVAVEQVRKQWFVSWMKESGTEGCLDCSQQDVPRVEWKVKERWGS